MNILSNLLIRFRKFEISLRLQDVIYGLPAILLALGINILVLWTLHTHAPILENSTPWLTAWAGVLEMFWLLGVGILVWSTAVDPNAGLLFLWAMVFAGLITLAGSAADFLPHAYLFGSPSLVFLAAVILHFHILFPQEVEERWRYPLMIVFYVLASTLATAWILRPDLPHLRALSRWFFAGSLFAAWIRVYGVGRWWGLSLEEKWCGRWLSLVLLVGGLVPTGGVLVAEMIIGRALMPLILAYALESVVPFGYFLVLRRYGLWAGREPISRRLLSVIAAGIEGVAFVDLATLGLSITTRPAERWAVIGGLAVAAYPLFRVLRWWIGLELYGDWYRRERMLQELAKRMGKGDKTQVWRWLVHQMAKEMGVTWVCVNIKGDRAFCWDAQRGEVEAPRGEAVLEVPVKIRRRVYGSLQLGAPLGRGEFTPWEQQWVEAMARLVGMRLAWEEREAEVRRLRAALAVRRGREGNGPSCPLSEREVEILSLVAAGKSDREIADEMHLSRKTVETYLRRIYTKLGVRNRAAAVAIAVGEGWIEPPEWYRSRQGNP